MAERHGSWSASTPPPPGWLPQAAARPAMPTPSGLFPGQPPRPTYREPHPIGAGPVLAGMGSAALWFVLFGSLARDLVSYAWWTVVAGITAWVAAAVLAFLGDRGVAVGIALTASLGLSIGTVFVAARWISTNDWPLW